MEGQVRAFLASLDSQPVYSSSTRLAYHTDLRCFVDYLQRTLARPPLLSDFTGRQITEFLEAEHRAGRRPSTLLRRRASLRRFAHFLREQSPEWAEAFDTEASLVDSAVSGLSPHQKPHYLTNAQIKALWAILESSQRPRARRDQAILALLLECGLTVGTLIALDLADLDLRTGRLHLEMKNKPGFWLPLESAAQPLQNYLREGRPELNYRPDEPALFISQTGGRMCRQGVWQVLHQWGSRARLPHTLSPRLARHTAALRLAQTGRPLEEIQTLLGHRNPLSTQALIRRLETAAQEESGS